MDAKKLEFGTRLFGTADTPKIRKLLHGWRKAMDKYAELQTIGKATPEDVAYWYGERPHISFLAAGAWLSGYACLEEFKTEKIRSRKKKNGRVDLYICTKSGGAEIEAKQCYVNASEKSSLDKKVRGTMKNAERDAKATRGADTRIACSFFVPSWRLASKNDTSFKANSKLLIETHLKRYLKIPNISWAWSFPKCGREMTDEEKGKTYYMPGVILGLKVFEKTS